MTPSFDATPPTRSGPMRPVFIFGADTGSKAFLSALLAAHDACLETPAFTPSYLKAARGSPFSLAAATTPFSDEAEFYLGNAVSMPGPETVGQLVEAYASDHGRGDATVWLEHVTPGELPLLATTFPEARFLHLVRDGRAVAAARWQQPGEPRRPGRTARAWREGVLRGLEAEAALGDARCLRVAYEALLSDLDGDFGGGLQALARFVGVAPEGFRLTPSVLHKDYTPHLYRWRTQLTLFEIKEIETVGGALLTELGYGLEAPGSGLPARPDVWFRAGRLPLRYVRPVQPPRAGTPVRRQGGPNESP